MATALSRRTGVSGNRLKKEKKLLENYFWPQKFPILKVNDEQCFEREVRLESSKVYKLRVCIQDGYPDEAPALLVCQSPRPMPDWGESHETHTLDPKDGLLRICHFHYACWTKENKLYEVFNKGEEWLEAYEKYLLTGKPICDYLPVMVPTQEEHTNFVTNLAYSLFRTPRSQLERMVNNATEANRDREMTQNSTNCNFITALGIIALIAFTLYMMYGK